MKLYKVPFINDYPDFRGNFIVSTVSKQVAYLSGSGKISLLNEEVGGAVQCLFDIIAERPALSIEAYVTSIERLVKAIR
jgi:hypothetical protein